MSLLLYYLLAFIECMCTVAVGTSLVGEHLNRKKLLTISTFFFIACYMVRGLYGYFNIPLGTHSFIIILIELILLRFMGKIKFIKCVISVLLSYLILIIIENITVFNIFMFFEKDLTLDYIRNITLIITNVQLLIIFYISYIKRFSIINMNKEAD